MHADIKGILKCGALGLPCFCGNRQSFFTRTTWRFHGLPIAPGNRTYFKTNLRCTRKSQPVVEKVEKEMYIKEDTPEYQALSSYDSAMDALSSLITRRNRGDPSTTGGSYDKLERVSNYLKILGLEEKMKGLKIIHVAGTKGKGSTCTFCEAILRNCGFRTGLFTSPHLIDVRERFRIDGLDISEEKFLQYFWECWKLLKEKAVDGLTMPPLFQFLTVLAFKIFICEKVDVAVVEVGLGGKLDSTNVIQEPIVCGVASLGMDHMETLGDTLAEIASHKAGIFKPQIPAFTVPQLSEAMEVLQQKANSLRVPLKVAAPLDLKKLGGAALSLSGDHQLVNAGLAVSLSRCWLQRTGNWEKMFPNRSEEDEIPKAFLQGLSMAYLPGRAQVVHDIVSNPQNSSDIAGSPCGDLIFYLDGAHSPESMEACGQWFSATVKGNKSLSPLSLSSRQGLNGYIKHEGFGRNSNKVSKQILLFNCLEVRNPQVLLPRLINTCASSGTHFSRALFVPSMSTYNKVISGTSAIPSAVYRKDLTWQFRLQRLWEKIIHGKDCRVEALPENIPNLDGIRNLPPPDFLYGDVSHCSPPDKFVSSSAVMPSLPLTISWLRDCVKGNPSLKLEVLVTGSLHLVGDVLRLLRR